MVATMIACGVRPAIIDWSLRAYGDSIRRIADTESSWWRSDIQEQLIKAGMTISELGQATKWWSDVLSGHNGSGDARPVPWSPSQ